MEILSYIILRLLFLPTAPFPCSLLSLCLTNPVLQLTTYLCLYHFTTLVSAHSSFPLFPFVSLPYQPCSPTYNLPFNLSSYSLFTFPRYVSGPTFLPTLPFPLRNVPSPPLIHYTHIFLPLPCLHPRSSQLPRLASPTLFLLTHACQLS